MSEQSFFAFLRSTKVEERELAVQVLGNGLKLGEFSGDQRTEILRLLTGVLDDPSSKVRRTLSSILVDIENVPYHFVHTLSRDQFDVALPLLAHYPGMREADLVDFIGLGSSKISEIIATRENLPSSVSGAIAEVGDRESCVVLLENRYARIAHISLDRMAERFADDAHVRASLLSRDDLSPNTRHDLLSKLSNALTNLVVTRKWLPPARTRDAMHDACEKATMEYAGGCNDIQQRALVAHLASVGSLTPGILIRALVIGNLTFVAEALAHLAHVPVKRAYRLMRDRRGAGLNALLTKAGLPMPVHAGFSLAIGCVFESQNEGLDFTSMHDRRRLVERILTQYEEYTNDDLDYLFTLLMRLSAEAALEESRSNLGGMAQDNMAA